MTRVTLALVVLLAAVPAFAQEPAPAMDLDLEAIGVGPVFSAVPIEADGKPGSEWLIRRQFLSSDLYVVYPAHPGGLCVSGPIRLPMGATTADVDGDNKAEIVRFDFTTQRVQMWPLPGCAER